MKPATLLVLLIALALGGIATYFGRAIVSRQVAQPAAAVEGRIVVAAAPLSFGTELTNENLIEIPWAASVLPEGAFKSRQDVLGEGRRVALTAMSRNEPIVASRITGPGQRASLAGMLDEGMRAVTIRVDDVRGVAGFVRPNDRVDLVLTQTYNGSPVADVLLQSVKVLAVDQVANDRQEGAMLAKAVTLEVSSQQAQKLVLAQGIGSLSLILRQPDGKIDASVRRVTMADLSGVDTAAEERAKLEARLKLEEQEKMAALEAQIRDMKALAEKSGEQGRQEFANRVAQLEARMSSELRRLSDRPTEKVLERVIEQPAPVANPNSVIRVMRGGRLEEYSVLRE